MAYLYKNVKQSILEENQIDRKEETMRETSAAVLKVYNACEFGEKCVHISRAEIEFCLKKRTAI